MNDIDLARRLRLCAALFAAASALAACGGGGGGSGPPPPAPPPASTVSGLLPAAPPVGAVLETDATTLRVFRPGATWTYHGADAPYGAGQPVTSYVNVVTQAQAAGGVTEHSTNLFDGGVDDTPQQWSGGTLSTPDSIQVDPSRPADQVSFVELRSPVRVDDQVTVYDRHFDDSGVDYDQDGTHDAIDVAIWTRVVGAEAIDLPNRRGVSAIRVDTFLDQRVRYSASGQYSDVFETVRSVWYAKGLGVVQTRLDTWGPNVASVRAITTETLDTWDGLTEGLGYRPTQALVVPSGESAGQPVPAPIGAVAFDDHAVAMSFIPGTFQADGIALTALDRDGKVLSSTNHHGMALFGEWMTPQKLLAMGDELRVVTLLDEGISLIGFDAQGVSPTLGKVVLVPDASYVSDADDEMSQSAASGNRLWLMWLSPYQDAHFNTVADLMLQSFDRTGQASTAPVVLVAGVNPQAIRAMRLSAASDRMIASWNVDGVGGNQFYAVADSASGALLATKVVTPGGTIPATGSAPLYAGLAPLALDPGLVLVFDSDTTYGQVGGVTLDASYDIVRDTGATTLGSEVVSQPWMEPATPTPLFAAASGHVVIASGGMVRLWADDTADTGVTTFSDLAPGTGALASTGTLSLLARVPVPAQGYPLPWSDRVLFIGGENALQGATATSTVVWRRPS